ncbi:unnamed protein product [Urochloa humidicola]
MRGPLPIGVCASCLLLLLASAAIADDLRFYISADCPDNMNYTRGGTFQANLGALLSSLPAAAAASSGFAENTTGAAPDQAFGLAQCRGDVSAPDCRSCLDTSAREISTSTCPGQKSAMLVYEGCLLRYSNASFFGVADTVWLPDPIFQVANTRNVTQAPGQFMSRLSALMSNLTREAAYGSHRMMAVGTVDHGRFMTIYGMAQCTRDITADDCNLCLSFAVKAIPTCCDGREGGRIFYRSCSVRFEVYPFYHAQAAEAPMPLPPAPGVGPLNGSDHPVSGSTTGAGSSRTVKNTALLVSVPVAITLLLLLLVVVCICKKNRKPNKHVQITRDGYGDDEEMRSSGPLQYDLSTLRAATNNFSEEKKLGKGGFGPVYKGTLENGQEIAVKRLSKISQQGHVEMKNEVVLVAKLQHKNLVRLLGFCIEEEEKLLVYEFLSNKSLDRIIFGPSNQQELSWEQRKKIIEGIGRGLVYLHEDSRLKVIHRDLKAGNILLDADMNPKISDFGLARSFSIDARVANTNHVAGTYGYMAPEYAQHGIFSDKSDVFSYGVLVLEIVTGRRAYDDLLKSVWSHWSNGSVTQLLDGYPADEPAGKQDMLRCIHIGLLCVQDDPQLRPSMASVLHMLKHRVMTMSAPTKPAFVVPGPGERTRAPPPEPSINEASVSDLEPR